MQPQGRKATLSQIGSKCQTLKPNTANCNPETKSIPNHLMNQSLLSDYATYILFTLN